MATIKSFTYSHTSPRVVFGSGSVGALPEELSLLDVANPLVVSSPSRVTLARSVEEILSKAGITNTAILDTAVVHNPSHIIQDALSEVDSRDCVISVGGGSAVGLAKAIALRTGIPHISIPTTYSGSEMTPILGETKDGVKTSTTHPRILPKVVIYDVDLTLNLPVSVSTASGVNALAHSFEALYAKDANPISALLAIESIQALFTALPTLVSEPSSLTARTSALYGAFLAGTVVASTSIALQHKLAHAAGATLNFPHAETHAIILPHSIAYNAVAISDGTLHKVTAAMGPIAGNSGHQVSDLVAGLSRLIRELGIPTALQDLDMREEDIDRITDLALEKPYWNPRPLDRAKIREIIRRAWAGEEARPDL